MRTQQRDFEIVISQYKDNLDWLIPYQKHATIYCKDPDNHSNDIFHLPPIGLESHTYLHHLIENYDDLAEMTLFMKSNIRDCNS